ncbi:ABC transporter permease subunit [Cereibacter azotoformans]|uniref:Taurine transport system permease protein n=1 Tax=Cereibacter azotoformans TaxID=43057 RepID=A0A2T5JT50_9RHOB|nr:ABC transporter permease subunit [Cereibacter azotoformans]PTR12984.1 taurine transport system permease protein [Cereibacter azotoformans]
MILLALYLAAFVTALLLVRLVRRPVLRPAFGDTGALRADRAASLASVVALFLLWGAFTGSVLVPIHVPAAFTGETSFRYSAAAPSEAPVEAVVHVRVHPATEPLGSPPAPTRGTPAEDDAVSVPAGRSALIRATDNDPAATAPGYAVTAIDGQPIRPGATVAVADGKVTLSPRGSLKFEPAKGWQMEPIWLPAPEAVAARLGQIAREGFQNTGLASHLGASLFRVLSGFLAGALVGIPLGYAMALSPWARGWFDPIVEFMRPVPLLALIPLVIIWFGIGEVGKVILLFLASLWIMAIAARSGVTSVRLAKVHAAYSLGASKPQLLWHVIVPHSLPDLFTGARVAMGVCWGTVVAAELVAAEKGAGMMIIAASKFQQTDVVLMGVILIGLIGYGIDILMRLAESRLVPWKGRA